MAEGWFVINHSLLNSTLYSQRFSFSDDSECRLNPLCKEWPQVFSLHPCDWEFMFLSCWCCLRTESSFSKAEDLASQIGCYWHGPKLDWWQSPCDRHPPASPSAAQKVWWTIRGATYMTIVNIFNTSPFQSGPIKMYQRPKSMKLSSRQNLTCKYFLDKVREKCINHSCNIKAESTVPRQKCLVRKNVFTSLLRTCLCDLKFQTVTKYVQPSLSENHSGWA